MKIGRKAIRTLLQRPSQAMFKLAVEAVMTGRIPPALRDVAPMKLLATIAYAFFLDELMKAQIDINRTSKASLAKYHERAWQRAETLLAEAKIAVPRDHIPAMH